MCHFFHLDTHAESLQHCHDYFEVYLEVHTWVRVDRSALKQDRGGPIGQGPVHTVTVSCYPANVCHTAKHISIVVIEDILVMRKMFERMVGQEI